MSELLDLFGDPVRANFGMRGRPLHTPTQGNRDKVSLLLSLGWSNERIANAVGVSVPTLRRSYKIELKARLLMRDRLDARIAEKLFEGVNAGNVGAIKEFRKFVGHNDLMESERSFRQRAEKHDGDKEKMGKKAQRQANAEIRASQGRFAVPAAPRSVQ